MKSAIQEYCDREKVNSRTEIVKFKNSDGKIEYRPLSYIIDIEAFAAKIVEERQIAVPKFVLGCDYGKGRLVVLLS